MCFFIFTQTDLYHKFTDHLNVDNEELEPRELRKREKVEM